MKSNNLVTLIVSFSREGKKARKIEVTTDLDGKPLTHQAASRLARGLYADQYTRIVNKRQRTYNKDMRSYSDLMAKVVGY